MKNTDRLFAKLAIAMALSYQLLALIVVFLKPDLGVYWHTISEWAIGKYGWLMQLAFVSSGLSYLFLYLAQRSVVHRRWAKVGQFLLFICFVGTVGVGLFVSDPYPPDFTLTTTLIHTVCGGLGMLLLPLAAPLISYQVETKNVLKLTGFLPLAAFIDFIVHYNLYILPLGENAIGENVPIGYPPRVLFLTYHIWLIVSAYNLIKEKRVSG